MNKLTVDTLRTQFERSLTEYRLLLEKREKLRAEKAKLTARIELLRKLLILDGYSESDLQDTTSERGSVRQ
jgi:hypothetical protein